MTLEQIMQDLPSRFMPERFEADDPLTVHLFFDGEEGPRYSVSIDFESCQVKEESTAVLLAKYAQHRKPYRYRNRENQCKHGFLNGKDKIERCERNACLQMLSKRLTLFTSDT